MRCPNCNAKAATRDSRERNGRTMRRRYCHSCGNRFSTVEVLASDLDELNQTGGAKVKMAAELVRTIADQLDSI